MSSKVPNCYPGWVLLSESTSLLKVKDSLGDDALTSTNSKITLWGATALGQNRWRVPSWDMAPEFFIIGHVPMLTHKTGPLTIRYVMDAQQKVEKLGLLPLHTKALSFLLGILPPPAKPSAQDHELLVIWVGIDEKLGQIGSAAGSRSFIANYIDSSEQTRPINTALSVMVLAHEQFHQLADMLRGDLPSQPMWIEESLAQFYALRALKAAYSKNVVVNEIWSRLSTRKGLSNMVL